MSTRVVALRVAVVVCTALAGCLPVDTTPPACFADQPCPGGGVCRGGRCVPPSPRAVEVRLLACLGAADGACRSTLEPRLGVDDGDPRVCLVVGSEAVSLRWSPASGLGAAVLPLPGGRPLDAGLFFIDEAAACDRGLLQAGACEQGRGCVFALRRSGFVAPADDGPVVLDFGQGGCDVRWGEAAPAERCDGRDDDCDGRADESFPLGEACEVGVGACARPGAWVCGPDGASAWCEGEPGAPGAETADGRDEDCDGTIDEGQPGCALSPEGRVCGTDDGICAVGRQRCEVVNGVRVYGACVGADGAPVVGPGVRDERCDGVDEDCDGRVDEAIVLAGSGLAVGDRCPLTPECPVPGRVLCDGGAPGCLPDGVLPVEVCNGADDDCDGVADEDFELGGACTVGEGGCVREGVVVCGEDGTRCDAVAGPSAVERCGDGVDDDCDGAVDEGFDALDMPCEAGRGACVATGRWACDGLDPTRLVCDAAVSEPGMEQCNALDDDCDGSVDEDFDPDTDPLNCGGCGQVCAGPNVDRYGCVDGGCVIARCVEGYSDVDDDPATGCECNPMQFDAPDPELADRTQPVDPDCDGLDGELDAAVFASAQHGDDMADGRPTTPVRSLGQALLLAAERGEPIYLDVGRYDLRGETLTVPAGVDVHGGYRFDPEARSWAPARALRIDGLSVIAGSPRPLRYVGLDAPTMLDRVLVEAARGEPGRSSVAVVAVDVGDFLQLRDVELRGGDGGAGLMGQAGAAGNEGGEPGGAGRPPSDALCSGCGGDPGRGACQSDGGRGGRGGGGMPAEDATAGAVGLGVAGGEGGGPGGPGAVDGAVGESGGPGADGVNGDPGSALGRIEAETWVWAPAASPDGNRGAPGSGGGGGGGAWSPLDWFDPGGGGGGGGAGGCPGAGGGGAVGGGGSFSLLVVGGRVRLHGVYMRPGRGGTGGIGGHGGVGSAGQPGGGGVGDSLCGRCGTSGRGGRGGDGGCGGHAAGAAGGPSFAVLRVGRTDALTDAVPALAESGVVFTNPYGAALAAPAADEARGGLAAGIAGQGGGGGALMGCGPPGDEGPAGVEGVVGCCHVEGDVLECAALEGCE